MDSTDRIPMSAPDLTDEDVQAVADVARSGRLALGPETEEVEQLIAEYVGVGAAVITGKHIGACAVVGAGAVVAQDIPPRIAVAGVLAKPLSRKG